MSKCVYRQAHRQTDTEVNTEYTLSEFQECFFQTIIKDRSNIYVCFSAELDGSGKMKLCGSKLFILYTEDICFT